MHRPLFTGNWSARLMALAAAGAAVITLAHPSATREHTWPWVFWLALVWLVPIGALLSRILAGERWRWPPVSLTIGLAALAAITVVSALLSPFAQLSLLRTWPTLAGVALCFWLHGWLAAEPGRADPLGRGLAGFGGLLALSSLAGWYWLSPTNFWLTRNTFPFGHSNYTAGAMLLVLPWLVRDIFLTDGIRRVARILLSGVAVLVLLSTSSRAGVLAGAAIAAVSALVGLIRATWGRPVKFALAGAAAGCLFLAVLANPRLRELVLKHHLGDSARESNAQRSAMLEAGWRLGAARPLTGWGPGSVPLAYPKVRARLDGGVDDVLELHSTPAQIWATLGSSGLLATGLLLGVALPRLVQCMRSPVPSATVATAAASLVGYGLFCLTDHQLDLPALNALFVLNFALLMQRNPEASPEGHVTGFARLMAIAASAAVVALLIPTGRDLAARRTFTQSLALLDAGRTDESLAALARAAELAPYDPYYLQRAAGQLLEQRAQTGVPAEQKRLAQAAADRLEASLAAGCFQEFAHFNLGWLALEAGAPQRAIAHFLAAAREAPQRSGVYFGLGLAYRDTGHEAAAVRAFALEWINDPVAFTAPMWEWPDFAGRRLPVAREADRLLAELAASQPEAGYVRSLWHWWADGAPAPAQGFDPESDLFVKTISGQPLPMTNLFYGWGRLHLAWLMAPVDTNSLTALAAQDPDLAAGLARRAARHPPPDWHGFFTAGLENEPALLANRQYSRPGHGVLALHPDGPPPVDLFIRQDNVFVSTFASTLFPAKGWVPPRKLLQWLPAGTDTP